MTASTDPALPKDPAEYRRRPLGLGLWSLMALCVLCVLAGAGAAVLAPRLWEGAPAQEPQPAAEIAAPEPAPPPEPSPEAAEIDRLNARIAELESRGARSSEAAAAALAAAALVDATQASTPFGGELAALRAAAPGLPELAALAPVAEMGAPSRAALAASFPDYAARAASAARAPDAGDRLADRILYVVTRIVSVRRISNVSGSGPDAVLARAERALAEGDVVGALEALETLPPAAREAMSPWLAQAERRAVIDRQAASLRARAIRDFGDGEAE